VGIHPHEAARVQSDDVEAVRELCGRRPVVALGEMGLDYHYDFSDRASQRRVFEQQAALAARAGLPVVIHCRQAVADTLAVLRASGVARGVFHCFTGSNDEATSIIDAGFLLGFTGIVTFKGSDELRRIAGSIPADRLLLETDAPYLSPEPVRRQRTNEPANVMHTLACVARLRQTDPAALDQAVRANASALFGWP
jgi:TatD DNase family protein